MTKTAKKQKNDAEYFYQYSYYANFLTEKLDELTDSKYSKRFWLILLSGYVGTILNNRQEIVRERCIIPAQFFHLNYRKAPSRKLKVISYVKFALRSIGSRRKLALFKREMVDQAELMIGADSDFGKRIPELPELEVLPWRNFRKNRVLRDSLHYAAAAESDPIRRALLNGVPRNWVEHVDYYFKVVEDLRLKLDIVHVSRVRTQFDIFVSAHAVLSGAQLFYYQPGGHMGDLKYNKGYYSQILKCDRFYTYGWILDKKNVPGRAYRLEATQKIYKKHLVGFHYDVTIVFSNINEDSKLRYLRYMEEFTRLINNKRFPRCCLRPRGMSRYFSNKSELAFLPEDMIVGKTIDPGKSSLAELMAKSRVLVLLDHPSTAFLEAVFCRHPVLAVVEGGVEWQESYVSFLNDFINLGVLHGSMLSLVKFLNETDVQSWWLMVIKSEAFREFDRVYAGGRHR